MRARIRKEMETPSSQWNNEWQQVTGPESFIVSAVQNPKLMPLQGKTIAEIAKLWNKDPIDTVFDILIEDEAFTMVGMFIMDEPGRGAWRCGSPGSRSATIRRARRLDGVLGKEHPHPRAYGTFPRILRKYVREEKLLTLEDAIRKFTSLAGAAHALCRSRCAEGGDVGRCGGVRPGDGARPGDVRSAQSIVGGNALRAGERRAGDRGG